MVSAGKVDDWPGSCRAAKPKYRLEVGNRRG
jgi:hypothetical protein